VGGGGAGGVPGPAGGRVPRHQGRGGEAGGVRGRDQAAVLPREGAGRPAAAELAR
ncbi:unnamed protein product, partial [Heterosigma akashiwo]